MVDRSIIGAVIGGSLADPVKNYPSVFGNCKFFADNPYFLPNAVCTAVVILGLVVGFLFLEETHEDKRDRFDIGLAFGRQLTKMIPCMGRSQRDGTTDEARRCINDEKGFYQPIPTSPQMTATIAGCLDESATPISDKAVGQDGQDAMPRPKVSFYKSLTKQIKLIILSYGLLAL